MDDWTSLAIFYALNLQTYATLVNGDPLGLKWSIGGPYSGLLGLFGGNGLSGSHNQCQSPCFVCLTLLG